MKNKLLVSALLLCALSACGDKKEEAVIAPPAPAPAAPILTQTPDVGKVEQVSVTATGSGMTPGAAIADALKNAIAQVNGATVNAASASANMFAQVTATLDSESANGWDSEKGTATMQGQAFVDQIITQSRGAVSAFKVNSMTPPSKQGAAYTASIDAKVAKFKAPADAGKIKIVVAPLRSDKTTFNIGGHAIPAADVLGAIRQRIIDALAQSGRFTVLDRDFEGEMQNELYMIASGQTNNTDFAKLGQASSADLVWVGVVNDLGYHKQVVNLQTSDRDLVGYSGGWSVSQRMINLTTRQILQSATLQGSAPNIVPTTLNTGFNEAATRKGMESDIVKKATEAILLSTFPISVVERDGDNVVLSQGGKAVTENGRYRIYLQGKEIRDPQTGQSLGNMESLCCDVVINRVTPALSYGVLENVKISLDGVAPGALQIRESLPNAAPAQAKVEDAPVKKAAVRTGKQAQAEKAGAPAEPPKKDDW